MTTDTKPKIGRPTKYSKGLANEFCSQLALGKSLRSICQSDDMPSPAAVFNWLGRYPLFVEQYTRAKADSGDADADKLDALAEDVIAGRVDPQAARVAADIIKWAAAHKRPKKYGLKTHTEHSGTISLESLDDDELTRKLTESEQLHEQALH